MSFILLVLLYLHRLKLSIEKLSLLQVFLLLPNQLSLLKVLRQVLDPLVFVLLAKLLSLVSILAPLSFKLNHLLVRSFQLLRLLGLPLLFSLELSFLQFVLGLARGSNLVG